MADRTEPLARAPEPPEKVLARAIKALIRDFTWRSENVEVLLGPVPYGPGPWYIGGNPDGNIALALVATLGFQGYRIVPDTVARPSMEGAPPAPVAVTHFAGGVSFAGPPVIYAGTEPEFGEPRRYPATEAEFGFVVRAINAALRGAVPESEVGLDAVSR